MPFKLSIICKEISTTFSFRYSLRNESVVEAFREQNGAKLGKSVRGVFGIYGLVVRVDKEGILSGVHNRGRDPGAAIREFRQLDGPQLHRKPGSSEVFRWQFSLTWEIYGRNDNKKFFRMKRLPFKAKKRIQKIFLRFKETEKFDF